MKVICKHINSGDLDRYKVRSDLSGVSLNANGVCAILDGDHLILSTRIPLGLALMLLGINSKKDTLKIELVVSENIHFFFYELRNSK
jgi:hypothetical protein